MVNYYLFQIVSIVFTVGHARYADAMTTAPLSPTPASSATAGQGTLDWAELGKWMDDVFSSDATPTVIAFLALALSLVALMNQFSRGRKADLSVRFAKTPDYKRKADRLIITNHGAASARNIKLELKVRQEARAATTTRLVSTPEVKAGWHSWEPYRKSDDPFPIEILAPGAAFYLPIDVYGSFPLEMPSARATLTWRDKRIRRQSWTSTVSSTGQILGGPSLENFHAEKQARLNSLMP